MKTETSNTQHKIITIPNILSLFRLCLIPVFVWLYCVKKDFNATCIVLILSGVTDIADGFIARTFHMISDLGKILDPVADKLTQAAMLLCLVTRFPLMLVPLLLMAVKELYMGISGAMIIKKTGVVFGANWHGKVATCLLYAMMILHVVWPELPAALSSFSIILCVIMMALSLILYGIRNQKALNDAAGTTDKNISAKEQQA